MGVIIILIFGLNVKFGEREVIYENNTSIPPKKTRNRIYLNHGVCCVVVMMIDVISVCMMIVSVIETGCDIKNAVSVRADRIAILMC